jgi:3-methyladenine DNA glycosylase AlkD
MALSHHTPPLQHHSAARFFKVSPGSYAEHDQFLGISVPNLRKIARNHASLPFEATGQLLQSAYNEERLLALFILVQQYQQGSIADQSRIYQFYWDHRAAVNNWNLVDASAYHIVGHYLWEKDKKPLHKLAGSSVLWDRRIAIVATWYFIRKSHINTTLEIATALLHDKHDLIHKAVGWMLREVGKKNQAALLAFLLTHANNMPKTMLRYAMEKLSPTQKKAILGKS